MNHIAYRKTALRLTKSAAAVVLLVAALLAVAPSLFSQAAVGSILGGIFDSSGGSIAGAKVTITDAARGTTRVLTTGAAGEFNAPSLTAGTYTVRVEAQGFESVERTNVVVGVAQDVRVDLKLSPGAQTQTITVTEEVPAIDTTNATLGGTITNTSIVELPNISRNFLQLLQLRPGVVDTPGSGGTGGSATNGRRSGSDVIVIEGVTQFDLATSNALINGANKGGGNSSLPLDSVQEFTTTQNSPAEYGWRDGSAVNLGIKSGTNALHGSAYAFGRNAKWTDARSYIFTQKNGAAALSNLTLEQPGFTVGGPILKNKLFWFAGAEFTRQDSTNVSPVQTPTVVPGLGTDLSLVDACLKVGSANLNPLSAQIAGLIPGGNCIPQKGNLTTFMNMFPYNNTSSANIFTYPVQSLPSNNGLAKVDFSPNEKHHFSGFVYISRQTSTGPSLLQPDSIASPYWGGPGIGSTSEYAGSWTWTPNSSWVNDLRGGAAPNSGNSSGGDLAYISPNTFGKGGFSINTGVTDPLSAGFMCLTIKNTFAGRGSGLGNCGKNGIRGPQYQLDFSDKVSHLVGNHSLKFGFETVFVHFDDGSTSNMQGQVNFDDLPSFLTGTFPASAGSITIGDNTRHYREHWYASFIQDTWRLSKRVTLTPGLRWEYIGSPHSINNHLGNFDPSQPGGFVQVGPGLPVDTQIHPRKTNFNPRIGIAWDIRGDGKTVLRAGIGNLSSFPAILTISGSGVPFAATLCNGPGTATSCTKASDIVVNNYGNPLQSAFPSNIALTAGNINWTASCSDPTHTATCTSINPPVFPSNSLISATAGPTCSTTVKCSPVVTDPNLKNPKSLQYSLDLQRAITNSLTLDVAYVGVKGYDEIRTVDLNEPQLGAGWDQGTIAACTTAAKMASAANGYVAYTVSGSGTKSNQCKPNANLIASLSPYSTWAYLGFIEQTQNGFKSAYNGLQVTLDARNFHGLHFLTAYTYSHALDSWTKSSQATVAAADPLHPNYQYGSSDLDTRHRFRFSPTYQIPGMKSPGQMLQGWQVSLIWAYQTGFAWAPSDPTSNDFAGNGEISNNIPSPNTGIWQTWNFLGNKKAFNNIGSTPIPCYGAAVGCTPFASAPAGIVQTCVNAAKAPYATGQLQNLALQALGSAKGACYLQNGGVLTPPAFGTLGNAGRGVFSGPRYQDWDISVAKTWHVKERYSAQMRVECTNCFNHINYAQFGDGSSDPSSGGNVVGTTGFGYHTGIQGTMRQVQMGLKLTF